MLKLIDYTPNNFDRWNRFVSDSNNGTIFHRLDFLDYHGDKFKMNERHQIWLKGDEIFAVLPLGIFEEDGKKVARSPFGSSFGGLVHKEKFKLHYAVEIVESLISKLKALKVEKCIISITPSPYFTRYSNYFEFALLKNGFKVSSQDVFSMIELKEKKDNYRTIFSSFCRNHIQKARTLFDVEENADIRNFYPILLENKRRLNSKPTHSFDELVNLSQKFKKSIKVDIAIHKLTEARAGICYFIPNKNVIMTFYLSQEDKAKGTNGINLLVDHGVAYAVRLGYKYFDLGSATLGYHIQNMGVSIFKESFGATGFSRTYLEMTKL